jgi:hypothetical protein
MFNGSIEINLEPIIDFGGICSSYELGFGILHF